MRAKLIVFVLATVLAVPANADDAIAAALGEIVGLCTQTPEVTAVLVALQRAHRIGKPLPTPSSGETCWRVTPAISIQSMQFPYLCATNEALEPLLPDLYWRAPGTLAPISARLLTPTPLADVKKWAQAPKDPLGQLRGFIVADDRIGPESGDYQTLPGNGQLTQIECNERSD